MTKKDTKVNAKLDRFLDKLLSQAMTDANMTITEKTKILDRCLSWEKIKAGLKDDGYGSAYLDNDDDK